MDGSERVNTVFADRFHLDALLGRGGMAAVYRARHLVLDRVVALKLLRSELAAEPEFLARFRREAKALSRLDHPHITQVIDFGYGEDNTPYLVMEYVEAPTLGQLLQQQGALPVRRALTIVQQVAAALLSAHLRDVIHRDLKPDNIAVKPAAGQDQVKLLDFGLAKLLGPDDTTGLTAAGTVFGTPQYMSPEQTTGGTLDGRTDIFSLGLVAYEMLVGQPPFSGAALQVMHTLITCDVPPPSAAAPRPIPPAVDRLVQACTAREPGERLPDAAAVLERIEEIWDQLDPAG